MHSATRTKLIAMPLIKLRKLRSDLDSLIREVETASRREIDIAAEHSGSPAMIHEVLELKGTRGASRWRQLEKIYCSAERCQRCPHGPFWYEYRTNKREKTVVVKFAGKSIFDYEVLRDLRRNVRPGKAYVIRPVSENHTK
jgi:hypothetical protein